MTKSYLRLFAFAIAFPIATQGQIINTIAGNGTQAFAGNGSLATSCSLNTPEGIAIDKKGNVYIADIMNSSIRKIDHVTGIITNYAGTGTAGFSGDGGPATAAKISGCAALTFDSVGNLYLADYNNQRIRKVDTFGVITTVAGSGGAGFMGDGGPALNARFNSPDGLALDKYGNLYIVDAANHCIRKVDTAGVISTVAGIGGVSGFSGDGGAATLATIDRPEGIAVDKNGNLYIADAYNYRVRKVNTAGVISTVAGNGSNSYSGENVPAATSSMGMPGGVAVDASGNIYFTEYTSERVRKITATGNMVTVIGSGNYGYSGDGGPALMADLNGPAGIAVSTNGKLIFSDMWNQRVRSISMPTEVEQVTEGLALNVFPNPSQGVFNIDMAGYQGNSHIAVYNALGALVLKLDRSVQKSMVSIDLSNYAEGVYLLEISTTEQVTRTRIVVMDK